MRISLRVQPGLVTDDTTYAAAGAWADGSNVRFWRGLPQTVGGWQQITSTLLTGICRAALNWTAGFKKLIAFATNSHLYVLQGGQLYDITPVGFVPGQVDGVAGQGYGIGTYGMGGYGEPSITSYFPMTWTLANWGEQLIANPRGDTLYLWENDPSVPAAALANAPAISTCVLVAPNRQVHAFGATQVDGTYNPLCIRGSDLRNNTLWAPAPENNAFEVVLEGGGLIVAALPIGDYEVVWTDTRLFIGQDTGAPNQPYSYTPVPGSVGLAGAKAAVVVGSSAFWLGSDSQFYRYDLGGSVSPVVCPIRDDFVDNITPSQFDKIQASHVSEFNEIWFDYPDQRDDADNSRYIAVSLTDGSWFRGIQARSCRVFAQPYPIGVAPTGQTYWHEQGDSANGGVLTAYLESADMFVSEDQVLVVGPIWPDMKDQKGGVSLSLIGRLMPQGDEVRKGPFVMAPSEDRVDFRITGRLVRVRLESSAAPSFWRLGRPIVAGQPAGTR